MEYTVKIVGFYFFIPVLCWIWGIVFSSQLVVAEEIIAYSNAQVYYDFSSISEQNGREPDIRIEVIKIDVYKSYYVISNDENIVAFNEELTLNYKLFFFCASPSREIIFCFFF